MPKGCHNNHARGTAHGRFKGYPSGPLYRAWRNMRSRCRANHPRRKDYFDRGIGVCEDWNDYVTFAADMGPHPGAGWSLDRTNNDAGYSPANCRWAGATAQANNARRRSSFPARDSEGKFTV